LAVRTAHVGEQHEQVRVEATPPRRQPVVVAKPTAAAAPRPPARWPPPPPELHQLGDRDAVVLVQHRHGTELEQAHQRRAHAQRPVAIAEVLLGEQHHAA
jgi:hypothetical protein